MIQIHNGALLLDTPGMRELGATQQAIATDGGRLAGVRATGLQLAPLVRRSPAQQNRETLGIQQKAYETAMRNLFPAFVGLVAAGAMSLDASAQMTRCSLSAEEGGAFAGECQVGDSRVPIELSRSEGATDALWEGTIQMRPGTIELSTYQYTSGPMLIVRTGAWHPAVEFTFSERGLLLAWDEGVEAPPSQKDLDIFVAARELLSSEALWDREDDRDCENDEALIGLYCALASATATVMGQYQHRQPAMQAVRRVIGAEWPERVVDHRLMNFNNDSRTTLADVQRLFELAEESLRRSVR